MMKKSIAHALFAFSLGLSSSVGAQDVDNQDVDDSGQIAELSNKPLGYLSPLPQCGGSDSACSSWKKETESLYNLLNRFAGGCVLHSSGHMEKGVLFLEGVGVSADDSPLSPVRLITEGSTYSRPGSNVKSEVYCTPIWELSPKFYQHWHDSRNNGTRLGYLRRRDSVISTHVVVDHIGNRSYSMDFTRKMPVRSNPLFKRTSLKFSLRFTLPVDRPNEAHDFEMLYHGQGGILGILVSDTPIDLSRTNSRIGRFHYGNFSRMNDNRNGWLEELLGNVRDHDAKTVKARKGTSTTRGMKILNQTGGELKYRCGNELFYRTLQGSASVRGTSAACNYDANARVVLPDADGNYDFASYFHFDKLDICRQRRTEQRIIFVKVKAEGRDDKVVRYALYCSSR